MNTFTLTQRRVSARVFAVLTTISLLLSAFPASFFVAQAQEIPPQVEEIIKGPPPEFTICHANEGVKEYVQQTLPLPAIVSAGHFDHDSGGADDRGDIIPPIPDLLPSGKNWDTAGQEIYRNDCVAIPTTGSITIAKVAGDGSGVEFDFTGDLGGFALYGNSDTGSDHADIAPGQYTITESDEDGWSLLDITCDSGSWQDSIPSVTVDLSAGDDVTCTFTNRPNQEEPDEAKIKVFKWIYGEETGPALLTDFSFQIDDDDPINFNEFGFGYDYVATGTHTVNEVNIPDDYDHLKTICKVIDGDHGQHNEEKVMSHDQEMLSLEGHWDGWEEHPPLNEVNLDEGDIGVCLIINEYDPEPDPEIPNTCLIPDDLGDNSEFTVGETDAIPLQTILNDTGYALDVNDDQMNYQVWNVDDPDADTVTFNVGVLAKFAGNTQTFGYYEAGDGSTFVPVFEIPPTAVGDMFEVVIPTTFADSIGFAIQTVGTEPDTWHSEFNLNTDSKDNVAAYNPEANTYVLAFEDLLDDDNDYNDLVVEITDVVCAEDEELACGGDFPSDNLLANGSFEEPVVTDHSGNWEIFSSVPNWVISLSDGLELWANAFYGGSSDGDQNAELDGNAPTMITQTVSTVPGATYELKFDFSARPDADSSADNSVDALVDGGLLMNVTADGSDIAVNTWTTHSDTFVAGGSSTDISFNDVGTPNSYGSLIDNTVLCQISEPESETYRIDGYKYAVDGEATTTKADWTIVLEDEGTGATTTTTTDSEGYYYFEVSEGYYYVSEVLQTDWNQVSVEEDGYPVEGSYCEFEVPSESDYTCDFYNEYVGGDEPVLGCTDPEADNYDSSATEDDDSCTYPEEDGGSRSYSSGTRLDRPAPTPVVLGASTSFCPFLEDYMQMGWNNDSLEVTKLQMFLNTFRSLYGGVENPVTGFFGAITDANVKAFQEHYRSDVLDPWYIKGIVPHDQSTGFVYKTTLWKINDIVCPDYALLPDFEGEDLTTNVDLHLAPISD